MEYIRIIYPFSWNRIEKRFRSPAFAPSGKLRGGGISIIEAECIKKKEKPICEHLKHYYSKNGISSIPYIFWKFEADELPQGSSIKQSKSSTGDDCHNNIFDLTKKRAGDFFKEKVNGSNLLTTLRVCDEKGNIRFLSAGDIELIEKWTPIPDSEGDKVHELS